MCIYALLAMSKQRLTSELDEVFEELNDKTEGYRGVRAYEYRIGEHADGLAIDVEKGGNAPRKINGRIGKAAARAGYIITGVMNHQNSEHYNHTRLFLNEADDHFDTEPNGDELGLAFCLGAMINSFTQDLATLYPRTYADLDDANIDAEEIVRELNGVNTHEELLNHLHEEHRVGSAHMTSAHPNAENGVYAIVEERELPDGWTYADDGYVVKE